MVDCARRRERVRRKKGPSVESSQLSQKVISFGTLGQLFCRACLDQSCYGLTFGFYVRQPHEIFKSCIQRKLLTENYTSKSLFASFIWTRIFACWILVGASPGGSKNPSPARHCFASLLQRAHHHQTVFFVVEKAFHIDLLFCRKTFLPLQLEQNLSSSLFQTIKTAIL